MVPDMRGKGNDRINVSAKRFLRNLKPEKLDGGRYADRMAIPYDISPYCASRSCSTEEELCNYNSTPGSEAQAFGKSNTRIENRKYR